MDSLNSSRTWRWVNGKVASNADVMWLGGQPENRRGENCGAMIKQGNEYMPHDAFCFSSRKKGLCEIIIN